MLGKSRHRTRSQAQAESSFSQNSWGGGQNSDSPASKIEQNEIALLTNAIDYGKYIEGHGGSIRLSTTALPGSGTVHGLDFHPTSKKFLLVRGTQAWVASATGGSWTEAKTLAVEGWEAPTIAGDTGNSLIVNIRGVNTSNSNAGVLYWDITNSAGTRTFLVYKTLIAGVKSNLVASGTATSIDILAFTEQNSSGINGIISTIATPTNDTDSGNTLTCRVEQSAMLTSVPVKIARYKKDFVVFTGTGQSYQRGMVYINTTDVTAYVLGSGVGIGYPRATFSNINSQTSSTPYGRRYLITFSRIVNSSGIADKSKTRLTGTLLFESPSNSTYETINSTPIGSQANTTTTDYSEHWFASPITVGTPHILENQYLGLATLSFAAGSHYTHMSLYGTTDIGSSGVDPVTGLGNNRELYAWINDFDIGTAKYTDITTDDTIRARLKSGLSLRTRFWRELPDGECGSIVNDFLFRAIRGQPNLYYQQLLRAEFIGFYRPDAQFMTFDDGIQIVEESQDQVAVICSTQTWKINPKVTNNIDAIASVFTINSRFPASKTIGVTDWGSLQKTETGGFIARCSDGSVRAWDGSAWGRDYGENRVRETLVNMIDGSASAYHKNAYYLWYRTSSGDAYNTKCLRLGLGSDAGFGWSTIARATWLFPYLRVAGVLILDDTNLARLMVLDYATGNLFWIETFTNAGSSFTKAWKDKENVSGGTDIAATIRLREFIGAKENHTLYHEESHAYFRPSIPADGYLSGFQVGLNVYADGGATAAASASNAPRDGDIQLSKVASGRRLQPEITTTTSKFQLTGYDSDIQEQDKATIGAQFSDTDEATYQTALASNLKHWLCRPKALKNRATGTNYTLAGTAPTAVTGPDGKTYALSFPSGASYTQADTTSYSDFAVGFWCKTVALNSKIFNIDGTNDFYIQFTSNTVMDVNGAGNITVATIASGWHNFWIVRSGSTVSVYQAGALLGTVTVATARGGSQLQINPDGGAMILDDIRVYNATKTAAAISYYYDDVLNNSGIRALPIA